MLEHFSIPCKEGRVIVSLREEYFKSGASLASVLVMEDEFNVVKAIEMVLSEEGYEVVTAMTGQSALDQLQGRNFDLLVADLRLPDINGMEVIRKVKSDWPQTAVIVITGYPAVASAVESMKLGALDYLPKPFTDDELTAVVTSALKKTGKVPAGAAEPA